MAIIESGERKSESERVRQFRDREGDSRIVMIQRERAERERAERKREGERGRDIERERDSERLSERVRVRVSE